MAKCPYTWVRGILGFKSPRSGPAKDLDPNGIAHHLRVRVSRGGEERVDVALPAQSARWLMDLIPSDVMTKIYDEAIPIDAIQAELAAATELRPGAIFVLDEADRRVDVWLE